MCKSNMCLSPPSYSCPDEEGGTFMEPEAERRLAEARAAKLKEFQGNDLVKYSTKSSQQHLWFMTILFFYHTMWSSFSFISLSREFKIIHSYVSLMSFVCSP